MTPSTQTSRCPQIKQRIANNFSRAASSYDRAADLQQRVAARTLSGLPALGSTPRIVDLGTGTGHHALTLAQRYQDGSVIGMDLAMGMLRFAQTHARHNRIDWCSGDIESLPLRNNTIDLVYSSLAIQWCCLKQVLGEVNRVLKPGGIFAFSTLAQDSLWQLDRAWCSVGVHNRVNRFASFSAQQHTARSSELTVRSFLPDTETVHYPDALSLLHSLKALGVNTVLDDNRGLLSRQKLTGLIQAYELLRQPEGLPLSYQIIYGVLQKKL